MTLSGKRWGEGGGSNFLVTFPPPLLVFASGETASEGGERTVGEKRDGGGG